MSGGDPHAAATPAAAAALTAPAAPAEEHVVLVDAENRVIGTASKATVHHAATPLHRGFSVFLFDRAGGEDRLLLQQRSSTKKTWPLVWSNSCCGHPALGESPLEAAQRRIAQELGVSARRLEVLLPDYRYRAELDGIVENEFCPVLVGSLAGEPVVDRSEVEAVRWIPWRSFLAEIERGRSDYSPWCVEEARLLERTATFAEWRHHSSDG
jgi:isopentenyl-diphosphate delta-isomerase